MKAILSDSVRHQLIIWAPNSSHWGTKWQNEDQRDHHSFWSRQGSIKRFFSNRVTSTPAFAQTLFNSKGASQGFLLDENSRKGTHASSSCSFLFWLDTGKPFWTNFNGLSNCNSSHHNKKMNKTPKNWGLFWTHSPIRLQFNFSHYLSLSLSLSPASYSLSLSPPSPSTS